jgi:hypothetical protein
MISRAQGFSTGAMTAHWQATYANGWTALEKSVNSYNLVLTGSSLISSGEAVPIGEPLLLRWGRDR